MTSPVPSGVPDGARGRDLRSERLRTLVRADAPRVARGTTIDEAIGTMRQNGGDSLLVMAGGRLAGMLTERHVLDRVLGRGLDPESAVESIMDPDPPALAPDDTLEDALLLMERTASRTVALVDRDGNVEGVVRQRDVLAFVAEAFPEEILNLPPRPHQVPVTAEGG